MDRVLWTIAFIVALLVVASSSLAMMGGGHDHTQNDQSRDGGTTFQVPRLNELLQRPGPGRQDYRGDDKPGGSEETPRLQEAPARNSTRPAKGTSKKSKQAATNATQEKPAAIESKRTKPEPEKNGESHTKEAGTREASPTNPVTTSLHRKDDMTMHLVPGGRLLFPKALQTSGVASVEIASFYMDETQVTNHQYVEFLKRELPRIKVENGVVRGDGEIWMLLGEVKDGYEPIVFKDGQFNLNGVQHAACPVLRVTALGASAYVTFYGERLPTETEWLHAVTSGTGMSPGAQSARVDAAAPEELLQGHSHGTLLSGSAPALAIPTPVIAYPPDGNGVRGLNSNIGEWATRTEAAHSRGEGSQQEYMVLGGALGVASPGAGLPRGIRRYPWEAFGDVGFRCVSDASGNLAGSEAPDAKPHDPNPTAR